jgi:hypothetical protein
MKQKSLCGIYYSILEEKMKIKKLLKIKKSKTMENAAKNENLQSFDIKLIPVDNTKVLGIPKKLK